MSEPPYDFIETPEEQDEPDDDLIRAPDLSDYPDWLHNLQHAHARADTTEEQPTSNDRDKPREQQTEQDREEVRAALAQLINAMRKSVRDLVR